MNTVVSKIVDSVYEWMEKYILSSRIINKYPQLAEIPKFIIMQKGIYACMYNLFGPVFFRKKNNIEIDVTYKCNLRCYNCTRCCGIAPSEDRMTAVQIERFIKESIDKNKHWSRIRLIGGEPALNPEILKIVDMLLAYKNKYNPGCSIVFATNNFGKEVKEVLSSLPDGLDIESTNKHGIKHDFMLFNFAPCDLKRYSFTDFRAGCGVVSDCGLGLTPYGYYPCAMAGAVDRIFGFNIGRKELPYDGDDMLDLLNILCRYCGWFIRKSRHVNKQVTSKTWQKALDNYKKNKPMLSRY
jgi:hypothetical protein